MTYDILISVHCLYVGLLSLLHLFIVLWAVQATMIAYRIAAQRGKITLEKNRKRSQ